MLKRLMTKTTATLLFLTAATCMTAYTATADQNSGVAGLSISDLQKAGYRVDWINQTSTGDLRLPTITDDSFYAINENDHLIRFNVTTGEWLWSSAIGNNVFDLLSITEFHDSNQVYVLSDGVLYVTNTLTGVASSSLAGSTKPFQALRWVPNTSALTTSNTLVYGSSKGDLVWLNPKTGIVTSRYQIGNSVCSTPVLAEGIRNLDGRSRNLIIGTSADGAVIAIDRDSILKEWGFKLTAAVTASVNYQTNPSIIEGETLPRSSVFIAGQDQYLRAVDLHTGKPRWKVLTSSPLENSPAIYGDVLYQRIPSNGLACYETFPNDYAGKLKWTAEDVNGNVITTTSQGRLVCWDDNTKQLQILDSHIGAVTASVSLPTAKQVLASDATNGALFILTEDGDIIRLALREK